MFTVRRLGMGINVVQDADAVTPRILLSDDSEVQFGSLREFFAFVEDLRTVEANIVRSEIEQLEDVVDGVK